MIAIMITDSLLSCGDCCGGGNYATAKGGCLAKAALYSLILQGNQSRYAMGLAMSWLLEVPPSWIQTTLKGDLLPPYQLDTPLAYICTVCLI